MSVANKNPFAILGDDGEDVAAPRAAPAKAAAPAAAPQPQRNIPGAGGNQRRGGARNGAPRAAAGADAVEGDQPKDARAGRGRNGESRGRVGRGGRGRGAPRGRAFDRHSQTARVDSDKAVAQAWGGEDGQKELDNEQKAEADAQAEGAEAVAAAAAATPAAEAEKVPEEEEDKTMTLDQYLASKAGKKLNIESKAPREVAENSAYAKFSKHQKEEADYFASTKTQKAKTGAKKEGKQLLEIEQTFNQPAVQQRGGRGGARGGSRGSARGGERGAGRGRGGRGGRGGNSSVNLADKNAFPSLA